MMSLGVSKGGIIPPTDEDRRRIIKQMKVRTTLRGDKSWIHHHNSDSEDEKKSSPLSGRAGGGSPAPKPAAPQNDRSPSSKPQSGYLIRGVFTRTIDKTSAVPDSSSPNQAQKNNSMKGQSPGRSPSGYRMTTEDYKKLAPYNVRQKSVDGDEEDVPFSPDEHKKRTEAANSVLRRSAGRERAYVLSAAKKSNGSPTQEFPPLFAKRIEIEEEEGQQRRSPTVPGSRRFAPDDSSANRPRKTTPGSSWDEPKAAAASPSSPTTESRSQTSPSLRETSGRSSTSAGIRNGEDSQALNGKSSWEAVTQRGDSDKALKEKPEPFPWDEAPRATVASTNGSFPEHAEANNGFYPPKSSSDSRDRPGDAADELLHHYELPPALDVGRSSLQPDVPFPPTERAPVHREDTEYSFKRSVLGYEERSSSTSPEGPAQLQPHWNEFSGSTSLTERGQGPAGHGAHPELPRAQEPTAHEPGMVGSQDSTGGSRDMDKGMSFHVRSEEFTERRSSSGPGGSSTPAPETPRADESEPRRDRVTPAHEDQTIPTTDGPQDWRHSEPGPGAARSDFSSRESVLSAHESQHPVPLYQDPQPFFGTAPSHRIPAYVDSQVFSTRRPTLDPEGRVSDGARGHGEFTPPAGRHDSLPRDPSMSMAQRSHRVPFYMDSLNYNSTRLLSSSSERLSSPGFHPDSSTAGRGILFVKEYVNTGGFPASPHYGSGSLVDLTDVDRASYSHHSYLSSVPLHRSSDPVCSYCSREIRDCPKIIIEHLNIRCHEYCFRCGICHKAMGDLLDKIFIHRDIVHCDKCYEKLF
ncbi:PREDICTED: zinc finger protein 185 isoform X2 [Lepidothrix coronata]|uniref:Zinc finger protein 185 isoform X2 n=1 Tax=Lepidothrix coronata TaxID=321398 RepID=A0A6J0H7M0_9PASS|nr:PREDICTED: zinc finger protein 185 isoform X2 [Lepidothrix coronata]